MEIKSLMRLFLGCKYIKEINFVKFNRNNIKDMSCMFWECDNLTKINFYKFRTSNAKKMDCMFENCFSLTELNLSNFDTSKVNTMENMFKSCTSLTSLNLSNFDTSSVTDMSSVFENCNNLKYINLEQFTEGKNVDIYDIINGVPEDIAYCIGNANLVSGITQIFKNKKCEYFDCDENWKNNLNEKNIDGVCYGKEDEGDFFKYNKDDVYSYLYDISSVNDLLEEYTNITIIELKNKKKNY